jgi:hypothetical protein
MPARLTVGGLDGPAEEIHLPTDYARRPRQLSLSPAPAGYPQDADDHRVDPATVAQLIVRRRLRMGWSCIRSAGCAGEAKHRTGTVGTGLKVHGNSPRF